MQQNTPKFSLKLNLFDGIVLVVALIVGAVIAFQMFAPKEAVATPTPTTKTATYTIHVTKAIPETADAIKVGDLLEDTIKNLHLGEVVSFTTRPTEVSVLNEDTQCYDLAIDPTYIDLDIVITNPATIDAENILLTSGYRICSGDPIYARGSGYIVAGTISSIDRGITE